MSGIGHDPGNTDSPGDAGEVYTDGTVPEDADLQLGADDASADGGADSGDAGTTAASES